MTSLRRLVLDNQRITDISPLSSLPLEAVSLCGNQITDLTPLGRTAGLTQLLEADNPLRDDGMFRSFSDLQKLDVGNTLLDSLEGLEKLPITELRLRDTLIEDYTPLRKLVWLQVLETGDMSSDGLAVVGSLGGLKDLSVYSGTYFTDFTILSGLQDLQVLDIAGCTLDSLEGIERLTRLIELRISGVESLSDIEPLTTAPNLEVVQFTENSIVDFTPLLHCNNLREVRFDAEQEPLARQQLAGAGFQMKFTGKW